MPGDAVLLVGLDVGITHAGEVVVGGIELAHVVEAEQVILALASTPPGGAVDAGSGAALPLAKRCLLTHDLGLIGLDADAIEIFRVELHCLPVCAQAVARTR